MLAELLDLPHANLVTKIEWKDGGIVAYREIEGAREVVEMPLPCVVGAQKGLNEPRYSSLKGIMAAKKKTIAVKKPADVGVDPARDDGREGRRPLDEAGAAARAAGREADPRRRSGQGRRRAGPPPPRRGEGPLGRRETRKNHDEQRPRIHRAARRQDPQGLLRGPHPRPRGRGEDGRRPRRRRGRLRHRRSRPRARRVRRGEGLRRRQARARPLLLRGVHGGPRRRGDRVRPGHRPRPRHVHGQGRRPAPRRAAQGRAPLRRDVPRGRGRAPRGDPPRLLGQGPRDGDGRPGRRRSRSPRPARTSSRRRRARRGRARSSLSTSP